MSNEQRTQGEAMSNEQRTQGEAMSNDHTRILAAIACVRATLRGTPVSLFVSGSTVINDCATSDVDVVVYGDTTDIYAALTEWDAAGLYPKDLWRSFKRTVDGTVINILVCTSFNTFVYARGALDACIAAQNTGVIMDKKMRVAIHTAIMGCL